MDVINGAGEVVEVVGGMIEHAGKCAQVALK